MQPIKKHTKNLTTYEYIIYLGSICCNCLCALPANSEHKIILYQTG